MLRKSYMIDETPKIGKIVIFHGNELIYEFAVLLFHVFYI